MNWPYVIQQCVMTGLWIFFICAIVLEVRDFRRWEEARRAEMDSGEGDERAA
jgi:hypothetical protein